MTSADDEARRKRNQAVVETAVSEACMSLFEDYALPLHRTTVAELPAETAMLYCGVIGCTGEQIRGTLLLATSREPLGRTSPSNQASLREWLAELSNQLLGRIKNTLLRRGVNMYLSTPIVLRGEHLAPLTRTELGPFAFVCDGGQICVWFDVELSEEADLSEEVVTEGLIAEGTGTLF